MGSDWDRYQERFRPSRGTRARMRGGGDGPREPDLPIVRTVRWVARISGTALVLLVIVFMIGEGPPNPLKMRGIEIPTSLAFLAMLIGLVLAWKWEGVGGGLLLGAYLLFWLLNILSSHHFWLRGAFPIFPIVGFLYLFCWRQSARARSLTPW